jgi:hypothetical protein
MCGPFSTACNDTPLLLLLQVGFFDERNRRYITIPSKSSQVLNRLEKTKQERYPNLKAEKEVT